MGGIVVNAVDEDILEGNHFLACVDEGFAGGEKFGQRIAFVYGHGSFARFVVSTMKGNGETYLGRIAR